MTFRIAFQGIEGAYSDMVRSRLYPDSTAIPCPAFEDVFAALAADKADYAVIPVENSVAGRVADVHTLLPRADVFIIGEHFEKITHNLCALTGATLESIKDVHSHIQGISQCRAFLRQHGFNPVVHADTAGAARDVAYWKNPRNAAIASDLAARLHGLEILAKDIADAPHNTTRFVVLGRAAADCPYTPGTAFKTTLFFTLRNVPAALYKALGGFATNGVNLSKIESYLDGGGFQAAQFYVDVESHPDSPAMGFALQELRFYAATVKVLGCYRAAQAD